MPDYKIYPLDEGGNVSIATAVRCVGDTEALAFASLMPGSSGEAEVREGDRYVGRTRIALTSISKVNGLKLGYREPGRREPEHRELSQTTAAPVLLDARLIASGSA